jgi:hypothetical protein
LLRHGTSGNCDCFIATISAYLDCSERCNQPIRQR